MMTAFAHIPVLKSELIDGLDIKPDGIYVDGTLGGGGHAIEVARRLDDGKLICIDQDIDAIKSATVTLKDVSDRVVIVRDNFRNIANILDELEIDRVDGIYLDIGVSSHQLDTRQRGFSYMLDAPLDMRMDDRNPLTAWQVVNSYSEDDLYHIIKEYGEDRFARSIARAIARKRSETPIETTGQLAEIVRYAIPPKMRIGGNPAMRTFQAIRIEVNDELNVLRESIDLMIDRLKKGGILAIITFHSLEDRIVKEAFRRNAHPCICPPDIPICVCGRISKGKVLSKKPITPSEGEVSGNKRAHSAKLRIFQRN